MGRFRIRTLTVVLAATLAAGGLLASGASASAPAVSKTCRVYEKLDKELNKIDPSEKSGFDAAELKAVAKAFRNAAKKAPGKLKSAMNTIAQIYDSMGEAKTGVGAGAAFGRNAQKWSKAISTWSKYFTKNCIQSS